MCIRERRHPHTIRRIPDDLLEEIKIILPQEKSNKKDSLLFPFRKVLDGTFYMF